MGKNSRSFLDLPFSVGVDEVLALIGKAIEGPSANTQQKTFVIKFLRQLRVLL